MTCSVLFCLCRWLLQGQTWKDTLSHSWNKSVDQSMASPSPPQILLHLFLVPLPHKVTFSVGGRTLQVKGEPFAFPLRWIDKREATVVVEVFFHSHYGEPSLQQSVTVKRGKSKKASLNWPNICTYMVKLPLYQYPTLYHCSLDFTLTLDLEFTPGSGEWVVHRSDEEGVEQIAGKLEAVKLN